MNEEGLSVKSSEILNFNSPKGGEQMFQWAQSQEIGVFFTHSYDKIHR